MTEVMTPANVYWEKFCDVMQFSLSDQSCTGTTIMARSTLEWIKHNEDGNIDIEASISYFEDHGGCCDCEILANVEEAAKARGELVGISKFIN